MRITTTAAAGIILGLFGAKLTITVSNKGTNSKSPKPNKQSTAWDDWTAKSNPYVEGTIPKVLRGSLFAPDKNCKLPQLNIQYLSEKDTIPPFKLYNSTQFKKYFVISFTHLINSVIEKDDIMVNLEAESINKLAHIYQKDPQFIVDLCQFATENNQDILSLILCTFIPNDLAKYY